MKKIFFILLLLLIISCDEKDYNTSENYWLIQKKTQQLANHMIEGTKESPDKTWESFYNIVKRKHKIENGKKKYIFTISIPYFLRERSLKILMANVADKYIREASTISIDAVHGGIEDFSGIVASYTYNVDKKNNLKSKIDYKNYLSRSSLTKKGITHYLLKRDYDTLLALQEEKRKHKNKSLEYIKQIIVKKYKISKPYINEVLGFAKKYYSR